jgi:hypothetical protein
MALMTTEAVQALVIEIKQALAAGLHDVPVEVIHQWHRQAAQYLEQGSAALTASVASYLERDGDAQRAEEIGSLQRELEWRIRMLAAFLDTEGSLSRMKAPESLTMLSWEARMLQRMRDILGIFQKRAASLH